MRDRRALIIGLEGTTLSDRERDYIRDVQPWGVILFARNLEHADQIKNLVRDVEAAFEIAHVPILIDQEGGRVARLRPPLARNHPPAQIYGRLYEQDRETALTACALGGQRLAEDIRHYGINIDCAPCLDVLQSYTDGIIGDRAFGSDPEIVAQLGHAMMDGLIAGGVLPVIKHIPGHGRAECDSHHALPVVGNRLSDLQEVDFRPFQACRDSALAMTGHLLYTALDPDNVSTISSHIIQNIIRDEIGFSGLLMSDDISMQALDGTIASRAEMSLAAGCDLILHCNGDFSEMTALAAVCPNLSAEASRKTADIDQFLSVPPSSIRVDDVLWGELVSSVWKAD